MVKTKIEFDLKWNGWDEYYNYWDGFVEHWHDSMSSGGAPKDIFTKSLRGDFSKRNEKTRLDVRELPEPYYGNGEDAKCAVVHLNPGASCDNEISKFFGRNGDLIASFEKDCGKKYSKYAKQWSSLNDSFENYEASKVPGYAWWHNSNRLGFFSRFWEIKGLSEVFALEACPYHSKNWGMGMENVEKHIVERVIVPALVIANKNGNCAVFHGSKFKEIILKIKRVEEIGLWTSNRKYSLYKICAPSALSRFKGVAYILVIDAVTGMWFPKETAENVEIENKIKELVKYS